jgi:hypothetical protein
MKSVKEYIYRNDKRTSMKQKNKKEGTQTMIASEETLKKEWNNENDEKWNNL